MDEVVRKAGADVAINGETIIVEHPTLENKSGSGHTQSDQEKVAAAKGGFTQNDRRTAKLAKVLHL